MWSAVTNLVSMVLATIVTGLRATAPDDEDDEEPLGHDPVDPEELDADVDEVAELVELELALPPVEAAELGFEDAPPVPGVLLEPQAEKAAAVAGAMRRVARSARRPGSFLSSMKALWSSCS
jgi:hypothetical protein